MSSCICCLYDPSAFVAASFDYFDPYAFQAVSEANARHLIHGCGAAQYPRGASPRRYCTAQSFFLGFGPGACRVSGTGGARAASAAGAAENTCGDHGG